MTDKKTTKKTKTRKEKWTWKDTLGLLIFLGVVLILLNPLMIAGIALFALVFEPACRGSYWESVPEHRASNYDNPYYKED